jgi:DNA-3-methyladenine glycosylase II
MLQPIIISPMPSRILNSDADLAAALTVLAQTDPRLAKLVAVAGHPTLRRRPAGFAGLCAIICSQQLSTASAAAIWGRLAAAFDPFHHDALRQARAVKLARLGLSRPKIKTMKALGTAIAKGNIDLAALGRMDADMAHAALTALHGVGPWTADVYLLFCLGHADAWPAGDLALQEAAGLAFGLKQRPMTKDMVRLAEPWRPWRGVAAHLLWTYYRTVKRRDPLPVQARSNGGKEADGGKGAMNAR